MCRCALCVLFLFSFFCRLNPGEKLIIGIMAYHLHLIHLSANHVVPLSRQPSYNLLDYIQPGPFPCLWSYLNPYNVLTKSSMRCCSIKLRLITQGMFKISLTDDEASFSFTRKFILNYPMYPSAYDITYGGVNSTDYILLLYSFCGFWGGYL